MVSAVRRARLIRALDAQLEMNLTIDQQLLLAGIIATIVAALISWFASAWVQRRSQTRLQISYSMVYQRIISPNVLADPKDFKIEYRGELLPEPTLLSVEVKNTGNTAIENPPIEVQAHGATYVIPGWFEDVPPGYDRLWEIERTDAESCALRLAHINPGQTAKAHFLLDEYPEKPPVFKCPMANLEIKKVLHPSEYRFEP